MLVSFLLGFLSVFFGEMEIIEKRIFEEIVLVFKYCFYFLFCG